MRIRSLLALSLLSLASACHHRRRGRTAPPAALRWIVRPADGPSLRVEAGLVVRGAVRIENGSPASPPHPASPIAATARINGTWLFASEDGTVYRAPSALGALTVVAALPFRVELLRASEMRATQGIHSRGALAVIDATLRAWAVSLDGSRRVLPIERALSVCFASADEALAVTEPGVLRVSHDAGRSFTALRPPAGVPLAVWNADDRTLVRTTAGTFRYAHGALAPESAELTPSAWLQVSADIDGRFRDAFNALPVPLDRERSAQIAPGRIATVRDRSLVIVDARTGRELARDTLPGEGCALFSGYGGVRGLCRHEAWATLVASRDADRPGWSVLRDEARAEPKGPMVFDDATPAWVVHAPCHQRTVIDPREVCLYDERGAPHELLMTDQGDPIAMHQGAALALEAGVTGRSPRLFALRPAGVSVIPMPDDARSPVTLRWTREGIFALHAREGGGLALSITTGALPVAWRRVEVAPEYERGLFTDDGTLLVWGADARSLAWSRRGGALAALPPAVVGYGGVLALDLDAPAFCVGPWCRFGGVLTVALTPGPESRVIARADAPPVARPEATSQRGIRCEHGAVRPATDIDHGAAVSGHAIRTTLRGATLSVSWSGETVSGAISRAVNVREGARAFGRGVQGAREPAGLVEMCAPSGCDDLLASSAGFTDLGLGRAAQGAVEVQLRPQGGYVARADGVRDGVPLVTLVSVDPRGQIIARRTFALAATTEESHVGTWDGRDGLWIHDREGTMRFVALDASDVEGRVIATAPAPSSRTLGCEPGHAARGEARVIHRVAQVRGPGWFVEAGEWQVEEVLAVDAGSTCVRSITGGEARDEDEARAGGREEHEPVRSFVLRAMGAERFEGTAWSGERAITLRCAME